MAGTQKGILNQGRCKCDICVNIDMHRWATIMECKCRCHDDPDIIGHDSLCCSYPNGKRKDNPYSELKPASEYQAIINKLTRI